MIQHYEHNQHTQVVMELYQQSSSGSKLEKVISLDDHVSNVYEDEVVFKSSMIRVKVLH